MNSKKFTGRLWAWPLGLGALWMLFLLVLVVWAVRSERGHVESMAEREAKAFFRQIVITRTWNAAHGGIYVRASEDSPPNKYLPAEERTLMTDDGILLAKLNPAYMTRQMSAIETNDRDVKFHITSLGPVNPQNVADQWETNALTEFNAGSKDKFQLVTEGGSEIFRYMAPLYAKEECMRCHAKFGHAGRTIMGGISVSFPAGPYIAARKSVVAQTHFAFSLIFLVGLVGICGSTYLVQRKREEAEQANRTKTAFLANMSHDMRTPLNGIMGLTELMQKNGLEQEQDRYAEMVRHSAWNLLEIITDITDFSRIESGRLELSEKVFDIRQLLDEALSIFKFETANKGISLDGQVVGDIPALLKGDPFRIKQVLTNLVGNAVKFTPKGHVHVRMYRDELAKEASTKTIRLKVEVEDSGIGIPKQEQAIIFESFRQVDSSQYKTHEGTGLGLAICKQLIAMMGGSIAVTSTEGQGSTFTFGLLLSLPEEHEIAQTNVVDECKEVPDCSECRVLIVDDNALNQIFASEILKDEGHKVTTAENGREAMEALKAQQFDIIFMDVQMPEMDGLEATRKIRAGEAGKCARTTPIVAITAFAVSGDREESLNAGMDGYIVKPLESRDIINALAHYSGKAVSKENKDMPGDNPTTNICIDIEKALERLGGSRELFNKLSRTFLADTPSKLDALAAAMSANDMQEILRLSHSLKNSAGMVQADDMAEKALAVEMCIREEKSKDLAKLHTKLMQSARATLEALQRIVGE